MAKALLDADYITRDDKPVIRLFYNEDGRHSIEEVADFRPYFYAIPTGDAKVLEEEVKQLENVTGTEQKTMLDKAAEVKVLKAYTQQPRDVPKLREEIRGLNSCREVREADIPFARRYLIDSRLTPVEDDSELVSAALDIETYCSRGEPNAGRDPIIMVSYADSSGLEKVLTYGDRKELPDYVEVLTDEASMIKRLIELVNENNVDVLLTYNGDNFDFPYIKDRADKLGIKVDLCLDGSQIHMERRGMNMGANIKGRPHVDLYPVCRQVFNLPRYRLEDVYESMFGEEKRDDIQHQEIPEYWTSKNKEDFIKLLKYSLSDVQVTLRIGLSLLPLEYELSKIIRRTLYETARMGASQRVEALLIEKAYELDMLVPNRPGEQEYSHRREESYTGAYVVEPVKGVHDNIILLDFRSLYPSIIISHNIDSSTIDCSCCSEDGYKAPNGHIFCKQKRGFVPGILEDLVKKRGVVKAELKMESDPQKKMILNVKQQALKLLTNAAYGYYGFPMARWYCRECAEAITGWGRDYIHKTIKRAKDSGFEVVYGDTDSILITRPGDLDSEKIKREAMDFLENVNNELPEAMELEFEGFYPRGIFVTKKRYALMGEDGKLTVKGLETRRRDWAEIAKTTQELVLDAILKDRNPEKAAEIVKDVLQEVKDGRVPLERLGINTQITKKLGDYVQEGPHVVAVRKAIKEHEVEFKQGDIVTYIVTRRGTSISDKSQIIDYVQEGDYDPEYYINNQILPAVMRILEALGYTEEELKGLGKQMTLGEW